MLLQFLTCSQHHEYAARHVPQVKLKTVTAECEQHPEKKNENYDILFPC